MGGYEGVAQAAPLCRAVDRRHEPFVVQLLFFEWALFGLFRGVRSGLCETGEGCVWVCAKAGAPVVADCFIILQQMV